MSFDESRNVKHSNELHVISALPSPMKGSTKTFNKAPTQLSKEVIGTKQQLYSSKNEKDGLFLLYSNLPKLESSCFLTQEILLYCLCSFVKFLALDSYKVFWYLISY